MIERITDQIPTGIRYLLTQVPRNLAEQIIREKCQSVYVGKSEILCRILGDFKFFVRSDDIGFSPHLIQDGYWEYWLTLFMANSVKRGDRVMDIGANVGYYSVLLSDLVGKDGELIAIEPNPIMFKILKKNLDVNGFSQRSKALNIALSKDGSEGASAFFVPFNEPKNGTLISGEANVEYLQEHGDVFDVEIAKLDAAQIGRVDFIKIDVEGAEIDVLDSLSEVIVQSDPQIICEVNFGRGYGFNDVMQRIGIDGKLYHLDFDGIVKELTQGQTEGQRLNEDWLIYSGSRQSLLAHLN